MTPDPMTPDLDALEQAAKAATPGRWSYDDGITSTHPVVERGKSRMVEVLHEGKHTLIVEPFDMDNSEEMDANGRFIALADPTTILALIAGCRERDGMEHARNDALAMANMRTAERDSANHNAARTVQHALKVEAERDTLRAENTELRAKNDNQTQMIVTLRSEALEDEAECARLRAQCERLEAAVAKTSCPYCGSTQDPHGCPNVRCDGGSAAGGEVA